MYMKKKMKKKSQLQMMQTVISLLIFFIILMVVIVFFISNQRSKFRAKEREYQEIGLIKKTKILNFLPELQCSFGNVVNHDCYDVLKIKGFLDVKDANQMYYKTMLGNTKITLRQFDPEPGEEQWITQSDFYGTSVDGSDMGFDTTTGDWIIYDNSKSDYISKNTLRMPISLYDGREERYYFGMIVLETYS